MMKKVSMIYKGNLPLIQIPINGSYIIGVYKGNLTEFDILLRYRQFDNSSKSGWSRIRTPKHIHWAVDVLLKMQSNEIETKRFFLDFLIQQWTDSIKPLKSENERKSLLNVSKLLDEVNIESEKYNALAKKGEYSIKFLILVAKLLMTQEKTNKETAFMFKNLLDALKSSGDIFKIVSIATHR